MITMHEMLVNGFFFLCFPGEHFQWCADVLSCAQDRSMLLK